MAKENYFVSEKELATISDIDVNIQQGKYGYIGNGQDDQSIYFSHAGLTKLANPSTGKIDDIQYQQSFAYSPLHGMYVLDERDYQQYSQGVALQRVENTVLFNVEQVEDTYVFAKALIQEIIDRSSPEVGVISWYDEYQEQLALQQGIDYHASTRLELDTDSPELARMWKYYPDFRIVNQNDLIQNIAVFVLLFVYISIICFVAVSIIAYTRSMTIALNNKQVYQDLVHLGANYQYIKKSIKQQLKKIFLLPTVIGTVVVFNFFLMISLGNGHTMEIEASEWPGVIISALIASIVCSYMYGLYRVTLRKVMRVILDK